MEASEENGDVAAASNTTEEEETPPEERRHDDVDLKVRPAFGLMRRSVFKSVSREQSLM